MNTFSILHLILMAAIAIEASKTGDPLININESEEKGRVHLFRSRYVQLLHFIVESLWMFIMTLNSRSF